MAETLPVAVRDHPHWVVRIRPSLYKEWFSISECWKVVEKDQVQLRGWYYPHISRKADERKIASNWIASWADFMGHLEYWRFFQSGQFLHYFVVEETVSEEWKRQLASHLRSEVAGLKERQPAGYFDVQNFLFTVTEIFEFAARLATESAYRSGLEVSIELAGVENFALSTSQLRAFYSVYMASEKNLKHTWSFTAEALLSSAAEAALTSVVWFFERFGWMNMPLQTLRQDQRNFLDGRW